MFQNLEFEVSGKVVIIIIPILFLLTKENNMWTIEKHG